MLFAGERKQTPLCSPHFYFNVNMALQKEWLDSSDSDYIEVTNLFHRRKGSINCVRNFRLEIAGIERVRNPLLESLFDEKTEEYEMKNHGQVRILKLFHGTKSNNIKNILKKNLEVQRSGQRGTRFGAGANFTAVASFASNFCDNSEDIKILMFKVLVSKLVKVHKRTKNDPILYEPPLLKGSTKERYDTTCDNKKTKKIIVKFDNYTFCPSYIIYCRKV